jgi:imidazolonepropionase-like amidohydrolase
VLDLKLKSLREAIKAGLKVAYGTDSGVQPHGLNARQFAIFVDSGMTPLQAIRTATLVNAELLRMTGQIGTLKPGAYAGVIAFGDRSPTSARRARCRSRRRRHRRR